MAKNVYDDIARYYHLMFDSWEQAVDDEGQRLDAIFKSRGIKSVLDCTCGTGLQVIGLAKLGYEVTGWDNSTEMLRQARRNARQAGIKARWALADIRSVPEIPHKTFDIAISCGNSLAHLSSLKDLTQALSIMHTVTGPEGWCLVDAADYSTILQERPTSIYSKVTESDGQRVVFYDTRNYDQDKITATFNLLKETRRGWRARQFAMELHPWSKDELKGALHKAGFQVWQDLSTTEKTELLARKKMR